jgi:hypothetical protein
MLTKDQKIDRLSALAEREWVEGSERMGAAIDEAITWLASGYAGEAAMSLESITDKRLRDSAKDILDGIED